MNGANRLYPDRNDMLVKAAHASTDANNASAGCAVRESAHVVLTRLAKRKRQDATRLLNQANDLDDLAQQSIHAPVAVEKALHDYAHYCA